LKKAVAPLAIHPGVPSAMPARANRSRVMPSIATPSPVANCRSSLPPPFAKARSAPPRLAPVRLCPWKAMTSAMLPSSEKCENTMLPSLPMPIHALTPAMRRAQSTFTGLLAMPEAAAQALPIGPPSSVSPRMAAALSSSRPAAVAPSRAMRSFRMPVSIASGFGPSFSIRATLRAIMC
jgi:hypothetical protein